MTFTDAMKTELAKPLDSKHVKPPAPGKYGEYVEGWHVIAEANRIFGFDGWDRETVELALTHIFEENGKWTAGYRAKVRVTVGDVVREGTGCGSGEKQRNAVEAHESAIKEAETDAMKRAMMTFGYPFGLALYDKSKANVADGSVVSAEVVAVIRDMAKRAGVAETDICNAAKVSILEALPDKAADAIIKKLNLTIEANKTRTPVDAG